MNKEKLRSDIYSMIADVESEEWLEEIKTFLANRALYEERLVSRAHVSEEDIKYGSVFDLGEAKKKTLESMETDKLKSDLQKIIKNTNRNDTLQTIYDFLIAKENSTTGEIWNSLSDEQREEILRSYEESFDEKNLIPAEEVFKKFK